MANQNVKFFFTSDINKYKNLEIKDPVALYFIEDSSSGFYGLYKGENLIATGSLATIMASGLMSSEDKKNLDELVASGGLDKLHSDASINIKDAENGKEIGVAISSQEGNVLTLNEDGLFVPTQEKILVPEYSIEKQAVAEDGYASSYKLKKIVGSEVTYVGDVINVAKDMVLQSAVLRTVTEDNVPYEGAVIGDPYIDMSFNDASTSHIYVPVKGLVDVYTAGNGINIVDGVISVKLATETQDGALSKEDKAFIDSIPSTYSTTNRVEDTTIQRRFNISNVPEGTLVNYKENEIRIMCPYDAKFIKQEVGEGGNPNMYYMTFTTYAPDTAVTFKEGDRGVIIDEILDFENTAGTGVDKYGRKFKNHWFALASYDAASDTWSYFGKNSKPDKYIGWDYVVEYYNEAGIKFAVDGVRINLSNEDCHNVSIPYYMTKYATKEDVEEAIAWESL